MTLDNKFIVVDGNSLAHRAFYALPLLATSKGFFTNAVYGFTNMILKILEDEKPRYMAVAFDKGKATLRIAEYGEYKAHRKGTPEELRPQFAMIKQVLDVLGIPIFEREGYEADDLIGTLTAQAEEAGLASLIVTGDRDALQLISDHTKVMITRKGISEIEFFDEKAVYDKYGIKPIQVIDLKGLMGDASDNIPGVPGVGEKTAIKLIQEYGTVEELLTKTGELKGKLQERIMGNAHLATLSKGLATIIRDIPMELDWTCCQVAEPDYERAITLFRELEFKLLIKNFLERAKLKEIARPVNHEKDSCPEPFSEQGNFQRVSTRQEAVRAMESLTQAQELSMTVEGSVANPMQAEIAAFAVSPKAGEVYYFTCVNIAGDIEYSAEEAQGYLKILMENQEIKKTFHDAKKAIVLLKNQGIEIKGQIFDNMVAAYLVNPSIANQTVEDLASEYLQKSMAYEGLFEAASTRAHFGWQLQELLAARLEADNLAELYYQVELPLVMVLAEMELTGVALDVEQLKVMSLELGANLAVLTTEIYALAGEEFNINSPKQLGYILFERLGLPAVKKTKTGFSTNAEVLEELADQHVIVEKILEYRQYTKLKSTYVDAMTTLINPHTGKIHTTFNQTITATGRLSSTEPNLQNIPIRLELGRKIRKVFKPSQKDHLIIAADYSQIELRVLAHFSGDPNFIEAFQQGQDIHTRTAAEVFGVSIDEVNSEMRRRAKAVNFGIVYGLSDFGLARDLKVSRIEARKYIESYFEKYHGVREYIDNIIKEAREQGYVTTLLQRRRYLPDLFSSNKNIRNFGERTAMNTPIQGTAADIIKVAMLKVAQQLKVRKLNTVMILQVHDELIFDVPQAEFEEVAALIKNSMEGAIELKVPLTVDIKIGPNWYDVKKTEVN